jgi:hypothetical protein
MKGVAKASIGCLPSLAKDGFGVVVNVALEDCRICMVYRCIVICLMAVYRESRDEGRENRR